MFEVELSQQLASSFQVVALETFREPAIDWLDQTLGQGEISLEHMNPRKRGG